MEKNAQAIKELLDYENTAHRHTHSPPRLVCKPPEVSLYGSAVIYMLLILSVGPIGADRGHLASSASALWEMKDLSLMFYNRCKCDGHKPNNIIHELQRGYKQPEGGGLCVRHRISCDLMIYLLCPCQVQSITLIFMQKPLGALISSSFNSASSLYYVLFHSQFISLTKGRTSNLSGLGSAHVLLHPS